MRKEGQVEDCGKENRVLFYDTGPHLDADGIQSKERNLSTE